jgi:hypothetical protein
MAPFLVVTVRSAALMVEVDGLLVGEVSGDGRSRRGQGIFTARHDHAGTPFRPGGELLSATMTDNRWRRGRRFLSQFTARRRRRAHRSAATLHHCTLNELRSWLISLLVPLRTLRCAAFDARHRTWSPPCVDDEKKN